MVVVPPEKYEQEQETHENYDRTTVENVENTMVLKV